MFKNLVILPVIALIIALAGCGQPTIMQLLMQP